MNLFCHSFVKPIAFYLPQYHPIPENDKAHGLGFTEWTNVKKAIPLFHDHYQPRVPQNQNYYSLLDINVMIQQAALAKKNGIYGFCYYHYWFGSGKKLLEKPVEAMLDDKRVDIPFCLCWANENWSKRWDGGNNEIIVEQDYGDEDSWRTHLNYLIPFFQDDRYIRINNEPLFLVYKPELMPRYKEWVEFVRNEITHLGFTGIKIAVQYPKYYLNHYDRSLFDYYIDFEPAFTRVEEEVNSRSKLTKTVFTFLRESRIKPFLAKIYTVFMGDKHKEGPEHRNYDTDWQTILKRDYSDEKLLLGGFVDWDNTPRNKNGLVYDFVSPEKFKKYFSELVSIVNSRKDKIVFINAWNEWAEGAYLEPDERYKGAFLCAVNEVINSDDV